MKLYFDEDNMPAAEAVETMTQAAQLICEEEGFDSDVCSFSITCVDREEIQQLNREYRNVDKVTDVLSFPQFEPDEELEVEEGEEILLGDVVICQDRAKEQAEEFGHSYERELIYLFVHSLFHLFGYDHEEEADKKIMRAKEELIMNKLGITRE